MKTKTEFVTNSSCASFMIPLKDLTAEQYFMIYNHGDLIREQLLNPSFYMGQYDDWNIYERNGKLFGDTSMDNFDMLKYLLEVVKVDEDKINYCGDCYGGMEDCEP